jgi:hypothetical protein
MTDPIVPPAGTLPQNNQKAGITRYHRTAGNSPQPPQHFIMNQEQFNQRFAEKMGQSRRSLAFHLAASRTS